MMSWELCGSMYIYDNDGIYEGVSGEIFLGSYNNFNDAFKAFSKKIDDSEWPRLWVKVFKDETDTGEIIVAYSKIWGDGIFNENGI